MLYDPKWQQTTLKPYTLAHFIGWLEDQPPSQVYNWNDFFGACLLCQYAASIVGERVPATILGKAPDPYTRAVILDVAYGYDRTPVGIKIAATGPYTFGAALKRAKAFQEA